eukprot:6126862-Pyramimonas_sp.AAC.1
MKRELGGRVYSIIVDDSWVYTGPSPPSPPPPLSPLAGMAVLARICVHCGKWSIRRQPSAKPPSCQNNYANG